MELVSPVLPKWQWWAQTKMFLVITGWLAFIPTLLTGEMAEEVIGHSALVEKHSQFAGITVTIFFILFVAYLIRFFVITGWGEYIVAKIGFRGMWNLKQKVADFILSPVVVWLLALVGIVVITITGGLGAAISLGPNIDPIVTFIYGMFF